LYDLIFWFVN